MELLTASGAGRSCARRALPPAGRFVLALTAASVLAGCAAPAKPSGQINPAQLDDATFLAYLADQPLVSVDEAYRATLILADGEDTCTSHEQRREKLTQRGVLRPQWGLQPDQCIDKGSAAFMIAEVCGITGGLNRILLGSWGLGDRRYAYRELMDRGLITGGVDYQLITGGELTALLAKADEFMADRRMYPAASADLGPPPVPGRATRPPQP